MYRSAHEPWPDLPVRTVELFDTHSIADCAGLCFNSVKPGPYIRHWGTKGSCLCAASPYMAFGRGGPPVDNNNNNNIYDTGPSRPGPTFWRERPCGKISSTMRTRWRSGFSSAYFQLVHVRRGLTLTRFSYLFISLAVSPRNNVKIPRWDDPSTRQPSPA